MQTIIKLIVVLNRFMLSLGTFFNQLKPERFFVVSAFVLALFYITITPPFQSPDELHHFYRIYQVSEGQFSPVIENSRAGGYIPPCFEGIYHRFKHTSVSPDWKIKVRDLLHTFSIPYSEEEKKFEDFPDTAFYTPVSYLPQAFLFFILKHVPLSMGAIYYLLRLFNIIIWILCMRFCLKKLPVGKWVFTALLLLPMHIYIAGSLSGDLVNNCLCFILIALILDKLYHSFAITRKDILLFTLLGVLLVFTKLFYAALLLMLFLIPVKTLGSTQKKLVMLIVILLPVFGAALLRSHIINKHYLTYDTYNPSFRTTANLQPGADYKAQKQFLTQHPGNIPGVIYRSLQSYGSFYLGSYIGNFGRFMGIEIPGWLYIVSYGFLFFLALSEPTGIGVTVLHRLFFAALGLFLFSVLILSLYLQWTPLKADAIIGFQGRYLIPVFPLVFLSVTGLIKLPVQNNVILPFFLLLVHFFSLREITNRFYSPQPLEKIEFCAVDQTTADNLLLTDNEKIKLELRAATLDTLVKRSGNSSIRIPAWADTTCHFVFNNLRNNDQVQIRAYKKGPAAQLCLTGRSEACPNFYFVFGESTYTDKYGWSAIDFVMHMPQDCAGTRMHFFIRNLSDSVAYIDDLDFRVWKHR